MLAQIDVDETDPILKAYEYYTNLLHEHDPCEFILLPYSWLSNKKCRISISLKSSDVKLYEGVTIDAWYSFVMVNFGFVYQTLNTQTIWITYFNFVVQ